MEAGDPLWRPLKRPLSRNSYPWQLALKKKSTVPYRLKDTVGTTTCKASMVCIDQLQITYKVVVIYVEHLSVEASSKLEYLPEYLGLCRSDTIQGTDPLIARMFTSHLGKRST